MKINIFLIGIIVTIAFCFLFIENFSVSKKIEQTKMEDTKTEGTKIEETKIEIICEKGAFSFYPKEVPIINEYLKNSEDPKIEIERMRLTYISEIQSKEYYLLSYNCGVKLCDNLLIQKSGQEMNSILLSETSTYQDVKLSPDNKHITFLFGRQEGEVVKNSVIVIQSLSLNKSILVPTNKETILNNEFDLPIGDFEWINNELLKVSFADVEKTNYDELKKWMLSPNKSYNETEISITTS